MAKGVNKVILIGHLGKDPEVRYMPSGGTVTNVTLATNESWKDKQTGEMQERTEWHNVVFYSKLAEIAAEYLRKGRQVYIEGSLRTDKWQDKTTGQDRYTTKIVANDMQMLGSRGEGGTASFDASEPPSREASAHRPAGPAAKPAATPGAPPAAAGSAENDFEDDIPF